MKYCNVGVFDLGGRVSENDTVKKAEEIDR